ncbi:hypothetical protein [Mesorhizobium sp. B263B2A]|uniref:hypothetical protein n=1 Tax=Mesorhizobium sp. B263B2A TaxID=2876669 RepID=UPI001CD0D733|nr:hypothetical protein [Mesorhizobium sp. B263B2A]MCA0034770.1 hypothetical protein [Mesorhizobium sp. B263B2A]
MNSDELGQTLNKTFTGAIDAIWQRKALNRRLDMQLEHYWMAKRANSANPLVRSGAKYFSQNDEDGILIEILRRIGLEEGVALELGVGNGLENNSLILLMLGWKVAWIGNDELSFTLPDKCTNLRFSKKWITKENCVEVVSGSLASIDAQGADVISVDLDGNDIYILETLLEAGHRPEVYVVEYNGKFPPPVKWRIKYDSSYSWDASDYQGASLQEFIDVMRSAGYVLVCCNVTGANAFFVKSDRLNKFSDVPTDIQELFFPSDYNWFYQRGHWTSPKTIEQFLKISD